ncbi:hypothetical protein J6590_019954 [Homalodisca vitripennis]|nr:hypothetical protein J6590_019954 [Homalodisca vitripennis]
MMASVLPLVWKSEVRMLSRHRLPDVIYFGACDCRSVNKKNDDGKCIASGMEIAGMMLSIEIRMSSIFWACDCRSVNKKYDDGKCMPPYGKCRYGCCLDTEGPRSCPGCRLFQARDCRSESEREVQDDGKCCLRGNRRYLLLSRHRLPDVVYFGACDCRSVNKKYDDGKCIASGMEIAGTDVVQTQAPGCRLFRGP